MSTEENKQLVLRWKDEIWKKRNVNIIDELYAPDYVGHIVGTPSESRRSPSGLICNVVGLDQSTPQVHSAQARNDIAAPMHELSTYNNEVVDRRSGNLSVATRLASN